MGVVSTILGAFGFGIGVSLGLVIGYYFFIYFQSSHVENPKIRPLVERDSKSLQDMLPEIPMWVKNHGDGGGGGGGGGGGVVLVELLTGEKPISLTRFGENRSLAAHFMLAMEEGRVISIFDAMVIKEGTRDVLLAVANLAMRCLNLNGKNRPTMKEVAVELESIRMSHIPSTVQANFEQVMYAEELEMTTYGESTSSTFLRVDSIN